MNKGGVKIKEAWDDFTQRVRTEGHDPGISYELILDDALDFAKAVLDECALIPKWYENDRTLDQLDEFKAVRKQVEELGIAR